MMGGLFDSGLPSWLTALQAHPLLPLLVLLVFVVAAAVFFPVWLLILQTGLLFPPPFGFVIAMVGVVLSASLSFAASRTVIGGFMQKKASERVLRLVRGAQLEHIISLRLLPVLPFTLVNLSAGALGVPVRTFLLGTLLGMTPGVLAVTVLGDRAVAVIEHPTPLSVLALVGTLGVFVAAATLLRRWAGSRPPTRCG